MQYSENTYYQLRKLIPFLRNESKLNLNNLSRKDIEIQFTTSTQSEVLPGTNENQIIFKLNELGIMCQLDATRRAIVEFFTTNTI